MPFFKVMEHKISFFLFAFIFANFTTSVFSFEKYEKISDCNFRSSSIVEFICGDTDNRNDIFSNDKFRYDELKCGYNMFSFSYFLEIFFKNCRFREIDSDYFKLFENLKIFNASNVELESLSSEVFRKAIMLTDLHLSQNKLTEIPPHLFTTNKYLRNIDFSGNLINKVDPLAFVGADKSAIIDLSRNNLSELSYELFTNLTELTFLNISYNHIVRLDSNNVVLSNLCTLDVSHNNLTYLSDHLFDRNTEMKQLNLSYNAIGNLKVETLTFLTNLKHLNLKQTNITSIQLGTFSHQHKLISLDLSSNHLKEVNFRLFMPIMHNLEKLRLGGNQLSHLSGFRNELFPELKLLDITDNTFNCSYLQHFMSIIDWKKIHPHFIPGSTRAGETNIRGIVCNDTFHEPADNTSENLDEDISNHCGENKNIENILNELSIKLNSKSNDESTETIKLISILILIAFLTYFGVFLFLNRHLLLNPCFKSSHLNNQTLSASYNVEQTETLLL